MKKIYTLSMAMMLAALPALAQQRTMTLHAPVAPMGADRLQAPYSATYNAPEAGTVKKVAKADADPSMTLSYCGQQYTAYGIGCSESGVGIMFPADYLRSFVGNQITAINVAAPISVNISTQTSQKNALTKAKIMLCNEMNGTPVRENDVTLGTAAFEYNELKFTEPYTIEEGKDVYLYVQYENAHTTGDAITDYIIIVDQASQASSPNAGYLYSKFKEIKDKQIVTQPNAEWKQMAELMGANFCVTATVSGDKLPENIGTPIACEAQQNIKPGEKFDVMVAVLNNGANALQNVEFSMKVGDQQVQTMTANVYSESGASTPVMFGEYGIAVGQFTCDTEGNNIPYQISVSKVNGVENSQADKVAEGYLLCLAEGYQTNVVVEEFTSNTCPYCPIGITGMEQMKAKYGADGRFIPIAVHYSQNPNSPDPMNVADKQNDCYYQFVTDIIEAQGGAGAPSAYIMRHFENSVYPSPDYLDEYIAQWLKVESMAEVKATVAPTEDEKKVTLNVNVTPAIDDKNNYGISYTIVEDQVGPYRQSNGFSGQQVNAYGWQNKPASVAMKFDDVARPGSQYLPAAGSAITEFKKGETVNWSTTVDISKVKNLENYSIVAMLVNKDRNIIENAFMAKGVTSGIEAVAAEGNAVAIGVQGGVNMFTAGNIYTIDGRMAAQGVSGMVELPAGLYIVATPAGNAKVMVR